MTESNNNETANGSERPELGLAGRMTRTFIDSPLSPLLFFAMLFMGILGMVVTPRQEDPQISVPMVDIFIQYPGVAVDDVVNKAINPLERLISEIPGVEHVYSASNRAQGIVTVQFEVGEDLGDSIVKVHDKIQSNKDLMPPGVMPPLVKPKGIDDVPVVTITLWSKEVDDGSLRSLAMEVLQEIKVLPNTGNGFVVGGRKEVVEVEVYPERLVGHGVTLGQVANTIRTANSERQAGNIEASDTFFNVYTGSYLRTANEIERLVVGTHDGVPVYVRDIADVRQGPEEAKQIVTYYTGPAANSPDGPAEAVPLPVGNGEPAVTIAVAKKIGTNGVTVAGAIIDRVFGMKGHTIPDNVEIAITRNYGETADDKVDELILKLFKATGFVFLLVLLAFRAFRPAFVVLFVIPVVILFTVFAAFLMGYTIDRVSLFALIFSIGILVDDAIVVVENIYRRWLEKGQTDMATAIDAVREVGNPTILATFTVIAALLPMGFVRGMMGPYMEPIPALGSVAMLVSLLAAFAFTPWLAMKFKPKMDYLRSAHGRENKEAERLDRLYRRLLLPLVDDPGKRLIFNLVLWGCLLLSFGLFYTTHATVKMLPLDNKPEFSVVVDLPEGTALPVSANLAGQFAEVLRDSIPEITAIQTYSGTARPFDFNGMVRHYYLRGQPWEAELQVQLLHKNKRERTSHELAVIARGLLNETLAELGRVDPDNQASQAKISVVEMPPGPPVLQSVVAEVYSGDAETRRQFAKDMTGMFEDAPSLTDVDNYMTLPHKYWHFDVNTEKSVRRGVSVDTINQVIAMAMGGYKIGDIKNAASLEPTNIIVQVPLSRRSDTSGLLDLPVPTGDGHSIPLAELGTFKQRSADTTVFHKDLRAVEYVVAETTGRLGAPIYGMFQVEDMLKTYETPDGVMLTENAWGLGGNYLGPPPNNHRSGFEWTGEWTVTYETFRDMGLAFGAAIVLIYMLVVWEFGNFTIPMLIMAPIPLTLLGILPAHALMGAEFTATSMIGWIALAGIIVRNSILLVDFAIHEVRRGTDVRQAVLLSCKTRTRPIVITALALVAGSSVILSDPIFQGMAISLAAGVLVSTLLTLLVIPLGCIKHSDSLISIAIPSGDPSESPTDLALNTADASTAAVSGPGLWSRLISLLTILFYLTRSIILLLGQLLASVISRFRRPAANAEPPPPPTAPGTGGGPTPTPPPPAPTTGAPPIPAGQPTTTPSATAADSARSTASRPNAVPKEDTTEPPQSMAAAENSPVKPIVTESQPVIAATGDKMAENAVEPPLETVATGQGKPTRAKKKKKAAPPRGKTTAARKKKEAAPTAARQSPKPAVPATAPKETMPVSTKPTGQKRRGIRVKSNIPGLS